MIHRSKTSRRLGLMLTTTIGAALAAVGAHAQDAGANQLQEVVVTATRQADTVNRVPLSITAETQKSLDQQGVRNLSDLAGTVPSLNIATVTGPGAANPSIRGIQNTATAATAPTVGFYLDDTPLQKRNTGGGVFTLNGTPLPPLFDLERIEVLRGPQGTLYGGSSEGGTIRFITPTPSLTRYSEYARAEVSGVQDGGTNYEGGVAVGGPIVPDKLGFRISAWARHDAGYIDIVDPLTKAVRFKDANDGNEKLFRGSLLWAPNENSRITLSYFGSRVHYDYTNTTVSRPVNGTVTEPTQCYNTATVANLSFPTRSNPPVVATGDAACTAAKAANPAVYIRPGATYGPYNLGPFQQLGGSIGNGNLNPTTTLISIPSLTMEYDFPNMTVKSITSYLEDETKGMQLDTSQLAFRNIVGGTYTAQGAAPVPVPRGFGFIAQYPDFYLGNGNFTAINKRHGLSQEIRFASTADAKPFSWVAGVFFSNMYGKSDYEGQYDLNRLSQLLYGITTEQRYGVPAMANANNQPIIFDTHQQWTHDTEVAAYGEANYWVTERLKLTGGIRFSRVSFDYLNREVGPGSGFNTYTTPGAITQGKVDESPITPKVAAQYQLTDKDMVYVQAAKGFRPGGVVNLLSPNICGFAVGQFGLTVFQLPTTFKSDSVWSYEAGGKFRLLNNRVQVNGDVFRIDWTDPQVQVAMGVGCGVPIVANGGKARSQGFEVESQAAVFRGLTANVGVSYTDAKYLQTVTGAAGPRNLNSGAANPAGYVVDLAGTPITPIQPKWQLQVGGRYEHELAAGMMGYFRADYRWTSKYTLSFPGTQSYAPDAATGIATDRLNLRAGVEYRGFDINGFVNNIFSQKGNVGGGRSGCPLTDASCATFSSYNPFTTVTGELPRVYGLQIAYRH